LVKDLKQELSKRGLATTGLKAALVRRLQTAVKGEAPAAMPTPAELPLPPTLSSLTVTRLQQELKKRSLPVSGLKEELLARLSDATGIPVKKWKEEGAKKRARKEEAALKSRGPAKIQAVAWTCNKCDQCNVALQDQCIECGFNRPEEGEVERATSTPAAGSAPSLKRKMEISQQAPCNAPKKGRKGSLHGCHGSAGCKQHPSKLCTFHCCGTCCKRRCGDAAKSGSCSKHSRE
jgi:hypothetical protein